LGRAADADDIADVVGFLVSEQGRYMVGQAIAVTGGMDLSH
jgi:3-oxoacyl-[acyl-carrier protein] reductase